MSTRDVFVTGAGGFIGANLVRRLIRDGHRVHVLEHAGADAWRLESVRGELRFHAGDVRDRDAVLAAVSGARPEWLFHLAAHGAYSWQTDAPTIYETNVMGIVNVLAAARAVGVEAIVNAGSSSEYGYKAHAPLEGEPLAPSSHYGVTKAAATLRLYSVYGPYEAPERMLPTLIVRSRYGNLPPLVDPRTARDFVHVEDVVGAFVVAAASAPAGAVYNVGTGVQTTIGELVTLARHVLGVADEPVWGSMERRVWDTDVWVADPSRIRDELGWVPRVGLADGLRSFAAWMDANREVWPIYGAMPRD
jgi:dolichol-phosphate mannosyltransferase